MTLTDFLLARIAEDEATGGSSRSLPRNNEWGEGVTFTGDRVYSHGSDVTGEYLAWFATLPLSLSAIRVREDAAMKRALVTWMLAWQQDVATEGLRLLAQPYADHPDFNPAWRE